MELEEGGKKKLIVFYVSGVVWVMGCAQLVFAAAVWRRAGERRRGTAAASRPARQPNILKETWKTEALPPPEGQRSPQLQCLHSQKGPPSPAQPSSSCLSASRGGQ